MNWTPQGSRPAIEGQVEGITDREVVGAVNAVAPHPTDPQVLYIASVNGGIWKTETALAPRPDWVTLTPDFSSLSIGALVLDRGDASARTLVGGTGRFSSMRRVGGALLGVVHSTDDGASWTIFDNGGLFRSLHIRAVHAAGNVIVVTANGTPASAADGLYRTADTGQTWTHLSGTVLLSGQSLALAGSPSNADVIYAHSGRAIYRSADAGATWTRISNATIEALLAVASNVQLAAGPHGAVYAAVATNGRLSGLFRSGNQGATWAALDLPRTVEGANAVFGIHPGGQAGIHFSLAADRGHDQIVYIGGDRQPSFDEGAPGLRRFPNSIGALDYSGRLFRVDAGRAPGSQATPLTHVGTGSNSAPHADSRGMAIAANGDLIECDDGGVYRRTDPATTSGDWLSLNGSLQTSEYHSADWDAATRTVMGGAQDTGTQNQPAVGVARWPSVSTGDGGVVAVGPLGTQGGSIRYSSYQFLSDARRETFDANGNFLGRARLQLRPTGTGMSLTPQFYTPIAVNRAAQTRLVVCGQDAIWESLDRGDTLRLVGTGIAANSVAAVAYGGNTDANILYVGSGRDVFVRTGAPPAQLVRATPIGSTEVTGIALDPATPHTAFATLWNSVHRTADAGQTWTDVTGNLPGAGASTLRSVAWCGGVGAGTLVVGSNTGVFSAEGPGFATWTRLGSGLPAAPVLQLRYDPTNRVVLAATLGRGAWTITFP